LPKIVFFSSDCLTLHNFFPSPRAWPFPKKNTILNLFYRKMTMAGHGRRPYWAHRQGTPVCPAPVGKNAVGKNRTLNSGKNPEKLWAGKKMKSAGRRWVPRPRGAPLLGRRPFGFVPARAADVPSRPGPHRGRPGALPGAAAPAAILPVATQNREGAAFRLATEVLQKRKPRFFFSRFFFHEFKPAPGSPPPKRPLSPWTKGPPLPPRTPTTAINSFPRQKSRRVPIGPRREICGPAPGRTPPNGWPSTTRLSRSLENRCPNKLIGQIPNPRFPNNPEKQTRRKKVWGWPRISALPGTKVAWKWSLDGIFVPDGRRNCFGPSPRPERFCLPRGPPHNVQRESFSWPGGRIFLPARPVGRSWGVWFGLWAGEFFRQATAIQWRASGPPAPRAKPCVGGPGSAWKGHSDPVAGRKTR